MDNFNWHETTVPATSESWIARASRMGVTEERDFNDRWLFTNHFLSSSSTYRKGVWEKVKKNPTKTTNHHKHIGLLGDF